MIHKQFSWSEVKYSEFTVEGLTVFDDQRSKLISQSIWGCTNSQADPLQAIPELSFLTLSAKVHGINIYNLMARNTNSMYYGHEIDADVYSEMEAFDYLALWKAPSGVVHVLLMKDNLEVLKAFSELASHLKNYEPAPIKADLARKSP
ncbi:MULTISPECIES: hypothetical protein [unclassified Halomonas]|uniref:hypothetical protein n=1 Tax=unclassified Halomonas TaxID=2609666 RepID=UPI0020769811|nr:MULTISPECIES: hypothetical protein [unclassified Halomonas]